MVLRAASETAPCARFISAQRALAAFVQIGIRTKLGKKRGAELSVLVVPDPDVLDDNARTLLDGVIRDGQALDELRKEVDEEQSQVYAAFLASNKARVEALERELLVWRRFPPSHIRQRIGTRLRLTCSRRTPIILITKAHVQACRSEARCRIGFSRPKMCSAAF